MIKEQSIQDAKQKVSIVDVFRDLYPDNTLKKSGSDYVCVCPFHDDHSPSLHVSPKKNRVHCYVCETDMDIFALVMDKKNCNFFEAVKYIYRTHIPHIPLESIYVETSPEAREQYKAYEAQMTHMRLAHEYYIDHKEIIRVALEKLRWKITYEPLAFRLLNKTFTMTQVQTIYEVVLGQTFDRRNFHKKMTALGYIVPTDQQVRNNGRPGTLYTFDEEKYREQIENRNAF